MSSLVSRTAGSEAAAAATATALAAASTPRLLIAAAQPYQTVAGPALSVNFLHQPQLLPFQRLPFIHSSVPAFYFHALLHTLAEFAETPREVRYSLVKQLHSPAPHFWRMVGTLNQFSCTVYEGNAVPCGGGAPRQGERATGEHPLHHVIREGQDFSFTHPTMGAVELSRSSQRRECDVRLTLFREDYLPLAAMRMSGPGASHPRSAQRRGRGQDQPVFLSLREEDRRRRPLPPLPVPTSSSAFFPWQTDGGTGASECLFQCSPALREAERSLLFPEDLLSSASALPDMDGGDSSSSAAKEDSSSCYCGGLYGPLIPLPMGGGGGFAQRAAFHLSSPSSSSSTVGAQRAEAGLSAGHAKAEGEHDDGGGGGQKEREFAAASSSALVPPWAIPFLVAQLCARLESQGHLALAPPQSGDADGQPTETEGLSPPSSSPPASWWWVCAFDVQQSDDAVLNTPIELVIAAPKLFSAAHRVPPWRQRIGEPSLDTRMSETTPTLSCKGGQNQHTSAEGLAAGTEQEQGQRNACGGHGEGGSTAALVALKVEARQEGRVFLDGVFHCRRGVPKGRALK